MDFGKWTMPAHFVNIDRATPMLLPPDIRDWIPQNHIAHFILEVVEVIPEAAAHINWRGSGSEQYPPRMMLGVLIYSYVSGRLLAGDRKGDLQRCGDALSQCRHPSRS